MARKRHHHRRLPRFASRGGEICGLAVFERFGGAPVEDLGREEVLLERAATGSPCLAVGAWEGPVVVLGYGQPAADVELAACRQRGIPVLRRITGGTGVIHRGDLWASLALPATHPWAAGIGRLYDGFLGVLARVLTEAGADVTRSETQRHAARVRSPICFEDRLADTLIVTGGKAVGCAQARRRNAVLVHAAVLLGLDAALYGDLFRVPAARVEEALAPAAPGADPRALGRALAGEVAAALGRDATVEEPPAVPARWLDRYRTPRWAPVA